MSKLSDCESLHSATTESMTTDADVNTTLEALVSEGYVRREWDSEIQDYRHYSVRPYPNDDAQKAVDS